MVAQRRGERMTIDEWRSLERESRVRVAVGALYRRSGVPALPADEA